MAVPRIAVHARGGPAGDRSRPLSPCLRPGSYRCESDDMSDGISSLYANAVSEVRLTGRSGAAAHPARRSTGQAEELAGT